MSNIRQNCKAYLTPYVKHDCVPLFTRSGNNSAMTSSLGKRVRWARINRPQGRVSQGGLGDAIGLTRAAISQWENDETTPSSVNLIPAAQYLGVDPDWLVSGKGSPLRKNDVTSITDTPKENDIKLSQSDLTLPHPQDMAKDLPVFSVTPGNTRGGFVLKRVAVDHVRRPPVLVGAKGVYTFFMPNGTMEQRFHDGELLVVHPNRPCNPKDYVVVQIREGDGKMTYVKRLISRTDKTVRLQQYSPEEKRNVAAQDVLSMHRILTAAELVSF